MPKTSEKTATKPVAVKAPAKRDHVFLVDGSSYIFRAYHALPPLNRKSDGLQVNAVLGFCNMLWKLLRDMKPEERPTHLAVIFDKSEHTFRNEFYPAYKAHRPDAPDDLVPQFKYIREAVRAFDIPCLEQAGFEADDLIATYAREACEAGATTTIVSSDNVPGVPGIGPKAAGTLISELGSLDCILDANDPASVDTQLKQRLRDIE